MKIRHPEWLIMALAIGGAAVYLEIERRKRLREDEKFAAMLDKAFPSTVGTVVYTAPNAPKTTVPTESSLIEYLVS